MKIKNYILSKLSECNKDVSYDYCLYFLNRDTSCPKDFDYEQSLIHLNYCISRKNGWFSRWPDAKPNEWDKVYKETVHLMQENMSLMRKELYDNLYFEN